MISDIQLIEIAQTTKEMMRTRLAKYGFKRAMEFKRELQRALVKYGQKNKFNRDMDKNPFSRAVQHEVVLRLTWIEKLCRNYFMDYRLRELKVTDAQLTDNQRKKIARHDWEKLNQRMSY